MKDVVMRKIAIGVSTAVLLIIPQLASAQEGTAAGVATGAVTGAVVGGSVIGAGGVTEQNARMQPVPEVVIDSDPVATGSIRQRTCSVDISGNQSCTEVLR
jgi:hypothetical protein